MKQKELDTRPLARHYGNNPSNPFIQQAESLVMKLQQADFMRLDHKLFTSAKGFNLARLRQEEQKRQKELQKRSLELQYGISEGAYNNIFKKYRNMHPDDNIKATKEAQAHLRRLGYRHKGHFPILRLIKDGIKSYNDGTLDMKQFGSSNYLVRKMLGNKNDYKSSELKDAFQSLSPPMTLLKVATLMNVTLTARWISTANLEFNTALPFNMNEYSSVLAGAYFLICTSSLYATHLTTPKIPFTNRPMTTTSRLLMSGAGALIPTG